MCRFHVKQCNICIKAIFFEIPVKMTMLKMTHGNFPIRQHSNRFKKQCSCKVSWHMESCWKGSAFLVCCSLRNWSFSNWAISFIQYERIVRSSWSIVSIILQRVLPKIVPYTPREIHVIWERERVLYMSRKKITFWNKGSFS